MTLASRRHLVLFFLSVLAVWLVFSAFCKPGRHDLVTPVPLGSKLSALDRYLQRGWGSQGEVVQEITNADGSVTEKELGPYDAWKAVITFWDFGFFNPNVNELRYRSGELVAKDWGFLPG